MNGYKYGTGDIVRAKHDFGEVKGGVLYQVQGASEYDDEIVYVLKELKNIDTNPLVYSIDVFKPPYQDVEPDFVNRPPHYTQGGIETIDFMRAKMTHEQFEGYLVGNVIKYISRYNQKGDPIKDLNKAHVYLKWLIEHLEG